MPYSFSNLEPPKEDDLSIKDKTAEFILSPICPLFGGSTVCNKYKIYAVLNIPIVTVPRMESQGNYSEENTSIRQNKH